MQSAVCRGVCSDLASQSVPAAHLLKRLVCSCAPWWWERRQLIINALVFNVGKPFRKGLWTNPWLLLSLVVLIGFNLYVLWAPREWWARASLAPEPPSHLRVPRAASVLCPASQCPARRVQRTHSSAWRPPSPTFRSASAASCSGSSPSTWCVVAARTPCGHQLVRTPQSAVAGRRLDVSAEDERAGGPRVCVSVYAGGGVPGRLDRQEGLPRRQAVDRQVRRAVHAASSPLASAAGHDYGC